VLVRHAATGHTAERRYSGRTDIPLSAVGLAQAGRLAARVQKDFATAVAVTTSPLRRCAWTAAPVAAAFAHDATPDADLAECDFGRWDGRTFAEARAAWPAEHAAWLASTSVTPPGGESFDAVAARVRRFVDRSRAAHPGAALVVVSHTAPLKLLLRDALSGDAVSTSPAMLHALVLDPAGVSIVDIWPDGGAAVTCVNDTSHL
jgi:ribonuclease H / adenosylcobalamin/alpha-ribazole phosphatase